MSEFRYLAGLDPSREVEVVSSGAEPLQPIPQSLQGDKALLLNGGGKDSCASAELLKAAGLEFSWLNCFPNASRIRFSDICNWNERIVLPGSNSM